MRIALITFFCGLITVLVTMVVGNGVVVNGPLNVQEFFIDNVQSEFDAWSQRLIKVDDRVYYNDKKSCPDDLCQFMERFGILSVRVSRAECKVDWLLDGSFRVRVHYICLLSKDMQRYGGAGTWMFKLENEPITPEALLSILNARRNKCKTWIMILCLFFCVVVSFWNLRVFHRIRQQMPDIAWFVVMYIVWSVDIFVVGLVGMSVWITLTELMKR